MKLFPKIRLQVSQSLFRFSCGASTFEFKPEVYLAEDRVVLAIGSPPLEGNFARMVRILDSNENHSEALEILAMLLRHGARAVIGGWCLGPLTLRIACDPSVSVFSSADWRLASSQAGASNIIFES